MPDDFLYLIIGVVAFMIMIFAMFKSKGESADKEFDVKRRQQAMDGLENIRQRVQKKQGKIIDPDNLPPEIMKQILEKSAQEDAHKMAGTLKKMID